MEGRETVVNDQGTIADSFCHGNEHNISLDYRSEVFFSHFNAAQFLHTTATDGRQMFGFSEGEVSSVPAIVHFNGMYPGDGKRQLLQVFRLGLWWANDTSVQYTAKQQPLFRMGSEVKAQSWSNICQAVVTE